MKIRCPQESHTTEESDGNSGLSVITHTLQSRREELNQKPKTDQGEAEEPLGALGS